MSPIRIGFVGLSTQGWASAMLAAPLLHAPLSSQYTLAAISTTNPTSAAAAATKYTADNDDDKPPVKAYHGPTSAIAADPDLDLIAVAVRAPAHRDAAMPIIAAGKDLFIEWPAGRNLAETVEMANAAKAKGIRTMVGTQGWQSPVLRKIKSIVESGEIGRVMSTTVTARPHAELFAWGPRISPNSAYTADALGGATLLDIAVGHFLAGLFLALGPLSSITAVLATQHPHALLVDPAAGYAPTGASVPQSGAHQIAIAGILARGGGIASLHWRGGLETRAGKAGTPFLWTIDGEKGSLRVESAEAGGCFIQIYEPELYLNGEHVVLADGEGDNLNNVERAWSEFAKGEEGVYPTLEDAVVVRRMVDAVVRSAEEGRRVDL